MNAGCFGKDPPEERTRVHTRTHNLYQGAPRTQSCPWWTLYGHRGSDRRVAQLSPYEFAMHYEFALVDPPKVVADDKGDAKYHRLTAKGKKKIDKHKAESAANNEKPSGEQTAIEPPELSPGADYEIKSEGGTNWVAIPAHAATEKYRHDWVIKARARPHTPVVMGAVKPASEEEHKQRLLLLLFASWTLNRDHATLNETAWQSNLESCPEVRHLSDLRLPEPTSWELCFMHWYFQFQGVATEKLLRIVRNFAFVYCLPRENGGLRADDLMDNSDNEDLSDVDIDFDEDELALARKTHVKGAKIVAGADGQETVQMNEQHEVAQKMFQLAQDIWLEESHLTLNPDMKMAVANLKECSGISDAEAALLAAKQSRSKARQSSAPGLPLSMQAPAAPAVTAQRVVDSHELLGWLDWKREQLNEKQHEFLTLVVDRVMVELKLSEPYCDAVVTPLVWLVGCNEEAVRKAHQRSGVRNCYPAGCHCWRRWRRNHTQRLRCFNQGERVWPRHE